MKKTSFSFHIGSSSLLLIFVVLSLVSFAVLALSSSVADKKLTDKMEKKTTDYYSACNLAEEKLKMLNEYLDKLYQSDITETEYFAQTTEGTSFAIPVSEFQTLEVSLTFLYPEKAGDPLYQIDAWSLVNTNTPKNDTSLPVFQ